MAAALTVGDVAERSGVAVSAIHFYERQGLVQSWRTEGNQRRYERDVLRRLAIIKVAQEVGIPLSAVRNAFDSLPRKGAPSRRDWERISKAWAGDLDRRIQLLQNLRREFGSCIGCGCLSLDRCNVLNPEDRLASEGPGPARLAPRQPGRARRRPSP